jgi:hypothetical protein
MLTTGESNMQIDPELVLPEAECEFLQEKGWDVEFWQNPVSTQQHERHLLIVKNFDLGEHYNPRTVDLLIKVPQGFPQAAPDMFWVYPRVTKTSGQQPAQAEYMETILDRTWQRFSRHYSSGWHPIAGGLRTHFAFIRAALNKGD